VSPRFFVVAALLLGLAYVFITPPFEVPDEQNHFWRAQAISHGQLLPRRGPDTTAIVKSTQSFVWVLARPEPREGLKQKVSIAAALSYDSSAAGTVRFAAWYTPLPYVAQTLVARLPLRQVIVFYGGRIANLVLAVLLIALAIHVAPQYGNIIAAAALLPMSLYELASWSADATTIALAWLFTALLLVPPRRAAIVALAGFAMALCKPAYFLIALLALVMPFRRSARVAILGATLTGTVLAVLAAGRGAYNPRSGMPVDAAAQWRCIAAHPIHFGSVVARDLAANARFYVEEMIGRFGANEIKLAPVIITIEIILMIVVALTAGTSLRRRARAMAAATIAMTVAGILLSQYLIWSVVCGDVIEGVQGRYFLEILPLFLAAIAVPRLRSLVSPWVIAAVAVGCNTAALFTLIQRYW
jgi:uncharacterized membrane protein